MKKPQQILREDRNNLRELAIYDTDHLPSWKRPGNPGHASLQVRAHIEANWLDLTLDEVSDPISGRAVLRKTMMTLDRAAAIALRDLLNDTFKG